MTALLRLAARTGVRTLVLILGFGVASPVLADDGLNWLSQQANSDGSIARDTDIATAFQATAETLRTFSELGENNAVLTPAYQYLGVQPAEQTENLARRIIAAVQAGQPISELVNRLLTHQNTDGGFGDQPGYDSTVLDTAFALEALATAGQGATQAAGYGLGFLLTRQANDGSWADGANTPSVYLTALGMRAVWLYRKVYAVSNALTQAQNYLLSQREPNARWTHTHETALALIAILPNLSDASLVEASVNGLRVAQTPFGSWEDDVYTTALALRALRLADSPKANPDLASITGTVIDGQTVRPLSGVNVTLTGPSNASLLTAGDGQLTFTNLLAPGQYALTLSLSGYATLTTTTVLNQGQALDLGTLRMLKDTENPTTGTLQGTVHDAESGQPLAGVLVSIQGSGLTAVTNADGGYQIANVPAGPVTVTATLDGYATGSGSSTLAAGGVMVFSPSLPMGQSEAATAAVQGQVNDGENGTPLAGAVITVSGSATLSATTDSAGNYRIEGIAPGAFSVDASLNGYTTMRATATAVGGQTLVFSPTLYPVGKAPPGVEEIVTAGVTGVVVDASSNEPLAAATITASTSSDVLNVVPDTDGRFELTGLTDLEVTLSFALDGYVPVDIAVPLTPFNTLNIGQVRLRREEVDALLPDLVVEQVDARTTLTTDLETLQISGSVSATIVNRGTTQTSAGVALLAFYDADRDDRYNEEIDRRLGEATLDSVLELDAEQVIEIEISGELPFRDAPITVWVDSAQSIVEGNESNNLADSAGLCRIQPEIGNFDPVVKFHALQGQFISSGTVVINLTDDNGDSLIDEYDIPDIVTVAGGPIKAISGDDGRLLFTTTTDARAALRNDIASADIDLDGFPEIIAAHSNGRQLVAFEHTGELKWLSTEDTLPAHRTLGGSISIANLDGTGAPEIVVGSSVYDAAGTLLADGRDLGGTTGNNSIGNAISVVADIDLDGVMDIVAGPTAYRFQDGALQIMWQRNDLTDGFVGLADFDDDEYPEIVLVSHGYVRMLNHDGTNAEIWNAPTNNTVFLPGGGRGGAPTIADFDGDGKPEIGVAGGRRYVVFDSDGSILWQAVIQDLSSSVTGSTAFDFEGDGKAEVIYRDERFLRIYQGEDGNVLFEMPVSSRTAMEYPLVVDVDNDSHAEIVICANNGMYVIEDANDTWVDTRKIWNQHSYHITNINDDGTVPDYEESSWLTHNTYRLNTFLDRDPTASTDLTAARLKIIDNGAGQALSLKVRIGNGGLAPSRAGVSVTFYEGDPRTGGRLLGSVALDELAPSQYLDVRLDGVTGLSGGQAIYAVVDADGVVPECDEDNNTVNIPFAAETALGGILVTSDASVYGPNAPVLLSATVTNTGSLTAEFNAELLLEDTDGAVVQRFTAQALTLAGDERVTFTLPWDTATVLAGDYRVRGILRDARGLLIEETTRAFEVRHLDGATPVVSLRTGTDKPVYHVSDRVQLDSLVQNLSPNTLVDDAVLRLSIAGPDGNPIYNEDIILGQLAIGALRERGATATLDGVAVGTYQVLAAIIDGPSGAELARDTVSFDVVFALDKALTGAVTVAARTLESGTLQVCTETVTNPAAVPVMGLTVHQTLTRLDMSGLVNESVRVIDLPAGGSDVSSRNVATAGLTAGDYACVLQAEVDGELNTLAYAPFTVTEPPVRVDASLDVGDRGRLLVLLDPEASQCDDDDSDSDSDSDSDDYDSDSDSDDYDDDEDEDYEDYEDDCEGNGDIVGAGLGERAYLTDLLSSNGWSYTTVTDADAFTEEFHGGGYQAYALFSEKIKLDNEVQEALREAVYRGEGLLVAGDHDQRNNKLDEPLGIKFKGKESKATGVRLTDSELAPADQTWLFVSDKPLRAELEGAMAVGHYVLEDGYDEDDGEPAITVHSYGEGRTVYAGFDLLAEAALTEGVLFQELMLEALEYIHPDEPVTDAGSVIPVRLGLANQGIATGAEVEIVLPAGVSVVDAGPGEITDGDTWVWGDALAKGAATGVVFWLRLPAEADGLVLQATVRAGPGLSVQATPSLALEPAPSPTVFELIDQLAWLAGDDKAHKNALKDAEKAAERIEDGRYDKALDELLKVADELTDSDHPEAHQSRVLNADLLRAVARQWLASQAQ